MDEKRAMSPPRSLRRNRPVATVLICLAVVYTFWLFQPFAILPLHVPSAVGDALAESTASLVPLEAHIISKCPDTRVSARPSAPLEDAPRTPSKRNPNALLLTTHASRMLCGS